MESQYKSPNIVCSGCGNNEFLSPPLALGTVLCVKCFTKTEYKTGKKVFSSYPHPTNPYNYSEDELFLVLCFGGLVASYAADKENHIDKVYGWLKGENEDFFEGGIGLDDEEIKTLNNRLLRFGEMEVWALVTNDNDPEGDDKGIEIAKKLSQDERENLFNLLFGMLINQKDATIEEAAALIKICSITESNWISFVQYVSENTPFKIEDLAPLIRDIKLPLQKFKKDGDYIIIEDFNFEDSEDFGQNDADMDIKTEEEKESEQSNVNKPKPRVLYGGDVPENETKEQEDTNYYVKNNRLGIPAAFSIDPNKGRSVVKSNGETQVVEFDKVWEDKDGKKYITRNSADYGIYTSEIGYGIENMEDVYKRSKEYVSFQFQERVKKSQYEENSGCVGVLAIFIIPLLLLRII